MKTPLKKEPGCHDTRCRSAARDRFRPQGVYSYYGFRVVLALGQP